MLNGKRLSILGDSISTYKGVSDDVTANSTLIYNPYYYREPFPIEGAYWHIVMDALGLSLCVNNSYSGGNLSGKDNTDAGVSRARHLSRDDGTEPDIVIVFMGLNDLGRRVDASVFAEDYERTLMTIKDKYPDASVCCVNIPDRDIFLKERAEVFNTAIEEAVKNTGESFFIADLYRSRLNGDFYYMNTRDGLHPDEDGMRIIAEIVIDAIKSQYSK